MVFCGRGIIALQRKMNSWELSCRKSDGMLSERKQINPSHLSHNSQQILSLQRKFFLLNTSISQKCYKNNMVYEF